MNDLQNKVLGSYAAVRITNKTDFETLIEWLSIKNGFRKNGEPISKMNYPGDLPFAIFRDGEGYYNWSLLGGVDTNIYQLIDLKQLELDLVDDQKIIDANATVTNEVAELNEKVLTLVTNTKPEGNAIDSNIDSLVALIPIIEAKANIVVTAENYKSFVAKGTGIVPELRKWAKAINAEKTRAKKAYMESLDTYLGKVELVVNSLNNTAQKIDDDVKLFKNVELKKSRDFLENLINKCIESGIADGDISKEYADKFMFNEDWLKRTKWAVYGEKPKEVIIDEIKKEFERLVALETKDKQDIEFIDTTIKSTCLIAGIDEKLISREKYRLQLVTGTNLGEITKNITDEVNNAKKREEAIKAQAQAEIEHQKQDFEKRQKEAEIEHQKQVEKLKKQFQQAPDKTNEEQVFKRGDEIIAKTNGNNVVTQIKETPEKYNGKTWTKTFEFTGDLASLQMLNRYMEFLKQSNETFDFKEVKMTEKELADKETGELKKYVVKEVN